MFLFIVSIKIYLGNGFKTLCNGSMSNLYSALMYYLLKQEFWERDFFLLNGIYALIRSQLERTVCYNVSWKYFMSLKYIILNNTSTLFKLAVMVKSVVFCERRHVFQPGVNDICFIKKSYLSYEE